MSTEKSSPRPPGAIRSRRWSGPTPSPIRPYRLAIRLIGIPIVAFLSGHGQWNATFLIGALCAALSAVAWLGVDAAEKG